MCLTGSLPKESYLDESAGLIDLPRTHEERADQVNRLMTFTISHITLTPIELWRAGTQSTEQLYKICDHLVYA
jgi:hypothetical protein